jgi:hypothetical protein
VLIQSSKSSTTGVEVNIITDYTYESSRQGGNLSNSKERPSCTSMCAGLEHHISGQLPISNHIVFLNYRTLEQRALRDSNGQQKVLVSPHQASRMLSLDETFLGFSTLQPVHHNDDCNQSDNLTHTQGASHVIPYMYGWPFEFVGAEMLERKTRNIHMEDHCLSVQLGTGSEYSPSIEQAPQQINGPDETRYSKSIKTSKAKMGWEYDLAGVGSRFEDYDPNKMIMHAASTVISVCTTDGKRTAICEDSATLVQML